MYVSIDICSTQKPVTNYLLGELGQSGSASAGAGASGAGRSESKLTS
jgi:hypothetical protein